jgi:hypothetical protein
MQIQAQAVNGEDRLAVQRQLPRGARFAPPAALLVEEFASTVSAIIK